MAELGWGGGDGRPTKMPCPHCGKRLRGRSGVYSHIKAKHGGKGKAQFKPETNDEESFADRAVQAEIDRAAGFDNPDIEWLLP